MEGRMSRFSTAVVVVSTWNGNWMVGRKREGRARIGLDWIGLDCILEEFQRYPYYDES